MSSLEALRRFQFLLDQHDHLLGNLNQSRPRLELDELIAKLAAAAVGHEELRLRKEGQTRWKKELRDILMNDHMLSIVSIKEMNRTEMISLTTLAMPDENVRDATLGIAAGAMAEMVKPFRDAFVRDGLPADFVEQLRAAEIAFTTACVDRDRTKLEWRGVTRVIDFDLTRAWLVVDAILALSRKALRRHPEIRTELRRALLHRPRPALPAAPARRSLPAGESESRGNSTALVPADPAMTAPAEPSTPRPRISAWARVIALIKPAA